MTRPSDFMSSLSFSLSSLAQCPARVYSFVSLTLCDFLSSQYLSRYFLPSRVPRVCDLLALDVVGSGSVAVLIFASAPRRSLPRRSNPSSPLFMLSLPVSSHSAVKYSSREPLQFHSHPISHRTVVALYVASRRFVPAAAADVVGATSGRSTILCVVAETMSAHSAKVVQVQMGGGDQRWCAGRPLIL
jgi:hypothetical protein